MVDSWTPATAIVVLHPSLISVFKELNCPSIEVIEYSFGLFPGLQKVIKKGPVPERQIGVPTGIIGPQST